MEGFIIDYFKRGYQYKEIIAVIKNEHDIDLSLRQLHRVLRQHGLYRKGHQTSTNIAIAFIEQELQGSGSSLGYRQMHRLCCQNGIKITRKSVAIIQSMLDPEGVQIRKRNRLRRRLYYSQGPNWVWHVDGYDKLKPYGFPIHGAIDGFSRNVLWLEVCKSNKDPKIICSMFLNHIKRIGGVPHKVVADRGTENVNIAASQIFLRQSENSFRYGRSVSNQRIESWWSMLRRSCTNWWINFFRDLVEQGIYDLSDVVQVECMRFCFGLIIQNDLDKNRQNWNNHRIRRGYHTHDGIRPSGIPSVIYSTPSILNAGVRDFKHDVSLNEVNAVKELCCEDEEFRYYCSQEFYIYSLTYL